MWLCENFPCAYPVDVRLVSRIPLDPSDKKIALAYEARRGYDAICERKGRRFLIRVAASQNTPEPDVVESLLHEWAHARTWKHESIERTRVAKFTGHDAEFWAVFGDIYRRFYDEGGYREAWEF
jgi:hypothetical protein